jgi:hypothetical protein
MDALCFAKCVFLTSIHEFKQELRLFIFYLHRLSQNKIVLKNKLLLCAEFDM